QAEDGIRDRTVTGVQPCALPISPVIAYESGSVPEVMEQGRTGFIVKELDDAVQAVQRVGELSRKRCREVFDQRFTASRMASDYVRVYERVIRGKSKTTLAA